MESKQDELVNFAVGIPEDSQALIVPGFLSYQRGVRAAGTVCSCALNERVEKDVWPGRLQDRNLIGRGYLKEPRKRDF